MNEKYLISYRFFRGYKRGFSLIELMIAMVIGLILILGIATIFVNSSNNVRLQRAISNMQESGREAMARLTKDASATGAQYCSAVATQSPLNGFTAQRVVRNFANAPLAGASGGLFFGLPGTPDVAVTTQGNPGGPPYNVNPRFFIQGHDCVGNACTPALTVLGGNSSANIPAAGAGAGQRVPNSDVLTVRYLEGNGASISSPSSPPASGDMVIQLFGTYNTASAGGIKRLGELTPLTDRLFMVADCTKAAIFRGNFGAASVTALATSNQQLVKAPRFSDLDNARVFDMQNNFLTVTYFLQNVADPNTAGRVIPTLMRSENGVSEEVVRGVERLDFRYSVAELRISALPDYQNFRWMTANQVQTKLPCPPRPKGIPGYDKFVPGVAAAPLATDTEAGCNWRAVQGIEIGMLVTSVDPVSNPETTVAYSMDPGVVVKPATGNLLRREFRAIAPIKAWVQ